jgi:hypothetical protein
MAEMKLATFLLGFCPFLLAGCVSVTAPSGSGEGGDGRPRAISTFHALSPEEIAELRSKGPAGLKEFLDANAVTVDGLRWSHHLRVEPPGIVAFRASLDAVAKQRDASASGLFWYTDLEAAKAEAARTGRHILSLRLLGNLDEEYSCANSRFFRTALYANAVVSDHLREHYVLHWKSVRPAPLVTIDMGDGRRIKRTITGNSIHYALDSDGTVLTWTCRAGC